MLVIHVKELRLLLLLLLLFLVCLFHAHVHACICKGKDTFLKMCLYEGKKLVHIFLTSSPYPSGGLLEL